MDYSNHLLLSFLCSSISLFFFIIFFQRNANKLSNLPPGPPPFPIIGNLLEIGTKPHESLSNLSKIYGPLLTLKLGTITTIVISSPNIAKEALHKNDHVFSGRVVPHTLQTMDHHKISVVFMDPSPHWRTLRKICATKIFSPRQLLKTQNLRLNKVQELLEYVNQCCEKSEVLDIGEAAFTVVLNSISSALFSIDFVGFASDSSREFKEHVCGMMEEAGKPNIADFFPFLRVIDPQRARSRMDRYSRKLFKMIDDIVDERVKVRSLEKMEDEHKGRCDDDDVLDYLLSEIEGDDPQLSRLDVVHLFGDLLVAGVDTTLTTIEWAMAELLRNPEKLRKVREELQQIIGKDEKVEDSQILKLPFLKAVVNETLRLHPPAPLLLPHKAQDDVEICGFLVPKNAQVLVNIWAMGRDSSIWSNPNQFMPERFLVSEIDYKGGDFELIPFGTGRRMCPGLPLAYKMVHLTIASLVQNHEWKLEDGLQPNEIDMEEKFRLTLRKAQPLRAIPVKA